MLTGSAARGLETVHSDLDVIFVLERAMPITRLFDSRPGVELIPITLEHLETTAPYGSPDWGYR
jgi:predicted nucleotidyltransferase